MVIKPGDLFEIATPKGLAYFQCVLRVPDYSDLIRILPGFSQEPPPDFPALAQKKELYFVYFPLGAAERRKIVRRVGREPIPSGSGKPVAMRRAGARARGGKVMAWIIEDGKKERIVRQLSAEEKLLSIDSIWNDTYLIEMLSKGWMPSDNI